MKNKLTLAFVFLICSILIPFLFNSCGNKCGKTCFTPYSAKLVAMDNSGAVPFAAGQNGVIAKALLLVLSVQDTLTVCQNSGIDFSFFPAAYAECLGHKTIDGMDTFYITSNKDFDSAHPAGVRLNDLFKIKSSYSIGSNLYLQNSPSDTGTHIFTVKLVSKDTTKVIYANTLPIKLL